jgi:hypothetical protein
MDTEYSSTAYLAMTTTLHPLAHSYYLSPLFRLSFLPSIGSPSLSLPLSHSLSYLGLIFVIVTNSFSANKRQYFSCMGLWKKEMQRVASDSDFGVGFQFGINNNIRLHRFKINELQPRDFGDGVCMSYTSLSD